MQTWTSQGHNGQHPENLALHVIRISKGEERENGRGQYLKNNGGNLPKFGERHKFTDSETQQTSDGKNIKKNMPRHIIVKLQKKKKKRERKYWNQEKNNILHIINEKQNSNDYWFLIREHKPE